MALDKPLVHRVAARIFLTLAASAFGFALVIAGHSLFLRPAPPDQLPGYMTSRGLDAHASYRFLIALVTMPIVMALAMRPLATRLLTGRAWAAHGVIAALIASIWIAQGTQSLAWTILSVGFVVAICVALRSADLHWTRRDMVLVPTTLTVVLALIDLIQALGPIHKLILAAGFVFAARVAVVFIQRDRRIAPAFCFLLSPLALLLQTSFFGRDQRYFGWPPLIVALLSPFILARLLRASARHRLRLAMAWIIYPLAAYSYILATSLATAEGKPRAVFFEDAHHLVAASELLRGETLYRDIIPTHGVLQDGIVDYISLRIGPDNIGKALKSRRVWGAADSIAVYAVATAATGSPDLGLLAALIHTPLGLSVEEERFVAPLATLALIVVAARRRSRRLFLFSGAGVVFTCLTSIDFGAYAALVLGLAILLLRTTTREKVRAALSSLTGAAILGVPVFIALAISGIAGAYIRTTFFEVLTLGPVYALDPFQVPFAGTFWFPEVLESFFHRPAWLYLFWIGNLLFVAVAVSMRGRLQQVRRRILDALLIVSLWCVVVGVSYAERHHLYFTFAIAPILLTAVLLLRLSGARQLAAVMAVGIVIIAQPTAHLSVNAVLRAARGPIDAQWVEITSIPRARGALFRQQEAELVEIVRRYVESRLQPNETFFDFSNRPMLYFLLDRDCPIRALEVPFYQKEPRQREVIALLERSPHVRAAMIPKAIHSTDGVHNSVRAPLVWEYLQKHFEPDFEEGDVIFWRR